MFAVVIGLETYQGNRFPAVDFANADAEAFADLLREMYPSDRLDIGLFTNQEATKTTLDYELLQAIKTAGAEDVFIFFYAGHGFYGDGSNRLTTFDTGSVTILETSISVMDAIIKPLSESKCRRALLFIDACASRLKTAQLGRVAIADLNKNELESMVRQEDYCAVFLSCQPGQSSFPASTLKHGIWTYHLLQALHGEASEAIVGGRVITDVSLRDYLHAAVPRFIREQTKIKPQQVPEAIIRASRTFAVRLLPERRASISSNDLDNKCTASR